MKQVKYPTLSTLAVAIGLACGGTAFADDSGTNELSPPAEQEPGDAPIVTEPNPAPDTEYDQKYDTMDDPVSQPSATEEFTTSDTMPRQVEPSESSSGDLDTSREQDVAAAEEYAAASGNDSFLDESVRSDNEIGEFAAAIEKAGLASALTDGTEYTVFAPTDEAFQAYRDENGEVAIEELREVLRSHIVAGAVNADEAKSLDSAQVLTGDVIEIKSEGESLAIGDAEVVSSDIRAGGLTIHTIDAMLVPSAADARQAMEPTEPAQSIDADSATEQPDEEEAE